MTDPQPVTDAPEAFESPRIDPALFREVLGHYPTGVAIITGIDHQGEHLAMIVGTFTSVSLDPPLVAFLPQRTSKTYARLAECDSLCINVLTGEQEDVSRTIVTRWENKLEGIDWFPSPSGDPVLADSLAWLDVRLEQSIDAGDHLIAMCRIVDMKVNNPVAPLIFFQGGYGRFVIPPLVARMDDDIIAAVHDAVCARDDIDRLANDIGCEVSLLTAVNKDELAAVASAVGHGVLTADSLGLRMPMIPPIGDTFMATGEGIRGLLAVESQIRERRAARDLPRAPGSVPGAGLSHLVPDRRGRRYGVPPHERGGPPLRGGQADPGPGTRDSRANHERPYRLPPA